MWFNSKENRYSYRRGNFETFKPAPPYCVSDTLQSHEAVLLAGRANQRDNRCYVRALLTCLRIDLPTRAHRSPVTSLPHHTFRGPVRTIALISTWK